jgi:type VI secretion system protein ImpL
VVLGLIIFIFRMMAARNATGFEESIRKDADKAMVSASPDLRAEVAILRQGFLTALDTLKQSRVGKASGREALYELPWYLVIGAPSAGKTTAILRSGLSFPLAARGKPMVQGVGGTKNCDWFFTTEGVLLDTAGRYATETDDLPEWREFIKLLYKFRPQAPLNGLIVTVSVTELLNYNTPAFETYARQIRQRLNQLEAEFKVKVPVFLMVTKMDLVPGFSDFFEPMTDEERNQTWGAIMNHRQFAEGFQLPEVLGQHLDLLWEGLVQIGQDRMLTHPNRSDRAAFQLFPAEFRALKTAICAFVEVLVEKDPYHYRPLIRGLHFSSALREGGPAWMLGQEVATAFALNGKGVPPQAPPGQRSHFIQGFFRSSLVPDQSLIVRQVSGTHSPARTLQLAAGLAVVLVFMSLFTYSCARNRGLINGALDGSATAASFAQREGLENQLRSALALQLSLAPLTANRLGHPPLSHRWGLYVGNDLEAALRAAYYRKMSTLLLAPVKASLESTLRAGLNTAAAAPPAPSPAPARLPQAKKRGAKQVVTAAPPPPPPSAPPPGLYNALKLYKMLADRSHMDADELAHQLPVYWKPSLATDSNAIPPAIQQLSGELVAGFAERCKDPDYPTITIDETLAQSVCVKLAGERQALDPLQRAYADLKAAASAKSPDLTAKSILADDPSDLVKGASQLPGCFTLEGWSTFQENLEKALDGTLVSQDWVLSCGSGSTATMEGGRDANRERLTTLYKAEFDQQWQKFLGGMQIAESRDVKGAADALGRLSDTRHSPIRLILLRAVKETYIDKPSLVKSWLNKGIDKGKKLVNANSEAEDKNEDPNRPGHRFPGLAKLMASSGGAPSLLDGYFSALKKAKERLDASQGDSQQKSLVQSTMSGSGSPLAEAREYVDGTLLPQLEEPSRSMVRPMLVGPLEKSMATALQGAARDLNSLWGSKVMPPWKDLASKYPFSDSTNDATFADIQRFLRPDGPLADFMDKDLAGLVEKQNGHYAPLPGAQNVHFSGRFLATVNQLMVAAEAALRGGEGSIFELRPNPIPGISETDFVLDGQKLVYRNQQEEWKQFTWPGPGSPEATVQVVSNSGVAPQILKFPGRMGLLRMLEKREEKPSSFGTELAWKFSVPRNFKGAPLKETGDLTEYPFPFRLNFRSVSGSDPRLLLKLRRLQLPDRITQ